LLAQVLLLPMSSFAISVMTTKTSRLNPFRKAYFLP
jgi:hypothetical protein